MKAIHMPLPRLLPIAAAVLTSLTLQPAQASSHREAPFIIITTAPKVDATDFYMFSSYAPGREGYVTMIANYLPLQDAYGGPVGGPRTTWSTSRWWR